MRIFMASDIASDLLSTGWNYIANNFHPSNLTNSLLRKLGSNLDSGTRGKCSRTVAAMFVTLGSSGRDFTRNLRHIDMPNSCLATIKTTYQVFSQNFNGPPPWEQSMISLTMLAAAGST